jgi:hypothetical protein
MIPGRYLLSFSEPMTPSKTNSSPNSAKPFEISMPFAPKPKTSE